MSSIMMSTTFGFAGAWYADARDAAMTEPAIAKKTRTKPRIRTTDELRFRSRMQRWGLGTLVYSDSMVRPAKVGRAIRARKDGPETQAWPRSATLFVAFAVRFSYSAWAPHADVRPPPFERCFHAIARSNFDDVRRDAGRR